MRLFVKICGITDYESAQTAAFSGADAVGFVFASSPRQVSPGLARSIAESLPGHVQTVAVFRRPERGEIEQVLGEFAANLIQADHEALDGFEDQRVLPVFREGSGIVPNRSRFLYEGRRSGRGQAVDLEVAADMARLGKMVLAGGMRPDNVGRAIRLVRPSGVDVSSGVESAPGVKSSALIRSFVTAARAAEERLVQI